MVRISFIVSGYGHVCVLLSIVIVTLLRVTRYKCVCVCVCVCARVCSYV